MDNVSLMMVTYNRLNLTKQTVESIYNTVKFPFNFIIIDNASNDNTINYLNELKNIKNNIHLVSNNENKGIARGRNQALKIGNELNTEWYVTIDNDVLFYDNWLEDCINILKNNNEYGSIGINYEDTQYPIVKVNYNMEIQYKAKGNLGTATSCFNKKIHKLIGYFCEDYNKYSHEDADLYFRVNYILKLKIGYLKKPGIHIGSGENDVGEYREMKTKYFNQYLNLFHQNCRDYISGKKPIYIPYNE